VTDSAEGPTQSKYVAYSDELESIPPDEDELIDDIVKALRENNERSFRRHQHATRDAHAKSHGILRGELTVDSDLPEHLRQGLFATPATYPVIARLSVTAGVIRSDQVHGVRAMAIKVLGVSGPRAQKDDHRSQDFIMVDSSTFPFANVRKYAENMGFASRLAKTPDPVLKATNIVLRGIAVALKPFRLKLPERVALFARPNNHVLGETYHSAAPLRYGDYVAKISVAPLSESVTNLRGKRIARGTGYDALTKAVADFFEKNSAEYEVRAQLCTDPAVMPIEDATKEWPEILSPHQRVAKLTFPAQKVNSPARRVYGDDTLSFNSWNGLAAHRPLGGINRLKIKVYNASSEYRHWMNNVEPTEPTDISELPD